jgi:hypothetical protein
MIPGSEGTLWILWQHSSYQADPENSTGNLEDKKISEMATK